MIPFHRIANATPRAFFRYWRFSAHRAAAIRIVRLYNSAAEKSATLAMEKALRISREKDAQRYRGDCESMRRENDRLQETVNTLLCNGFEFTSRRYAENGGRAYTVAATAFLDVEWYRNTPEVQMLQRTVIELERKRLSFPIHYRDLERWEDEQAVRKIIAEGISRAVAKKIWQDLTNDSRKKSPNTR